MTDDLHPVAAAPLTTDVRHGERAAPDPDLLRELRRARGLTQCALAHRIASRLDGRRYRLAVDAVAVRERSPQDAAARRLRRRIG